MEGVYKRIWKEAKEYYKKGRPMDIEHIKWMMKIAGKICQKENFDESILIPLVILHDVGYAKVNNLEEIKYFDVDIRKAHMKAGEEIADLILKSIKYRKDKTKKIIKYVGIHDNWAFGEVEIYEKDKMLGTFKDLDYLWPYTRIGFESIKKHLKKNDQEMWKSLNDEKSPIYNKKEFSTIFTKELREKYLKRLKRYLRIDEG